MIFILLLDNKKNNQIYFLIDFCIYLFISSNRFVIGADEGTTPSRVGKIVQRDYFSSRFGRILSCSKLSNLLFESLFQTIQKEISFANLYSGAAEGIRTPNLSVRSRMLHPIKLQLHNNIIIQSLCSFFNSFFQFL